MGTVAINTIIQHWGYIAPLLTVPRNDEEYTALVDALDAVLDAGGADEDNPLSVLADRMGDLVAGYEATNHTLDVVGSGVDALSYLMDSHGLTQGALPEIASQGVMSEILSGKRELNLRQVRGLAARFRVPAQVFIG